LHHIILKRNYVTLREGGAGKFGFVTECRLEAVNFTRNGKLHFNSRASLDVLKGQGLENCGQCI